MFKKWSCVLVAAIVFWGGLYTSESQGHDAQPLLHCSVEDCLRTFFQDSTDTADWTVRSDGHSPPQALYLSQASHRAGQQGENVPTVGRLLSKTLSNVNVDLCVQFYCKSSPGGQGNTMEVLIKKAGRFSSSAGSLGSVMCNTTTWTLHRALVSVPTPNSRFQVVLQGKIADDRQSVMAVDDIDVFEGSCPRDDVTTAVTLETSTSISPPPTTHKLLVDTSSSSTADASRASAATTAFPSVSTASPLVTVSSTVSTSPPAAQTFPSTKSTLPTTLVTSPTHSSTALTKLAAKSSRKTQTSTNLLTTSPSSSRNHQTASTNLLTTPSSSKSPLAKSTSISTTTNNIFTELKTVSTEATAPSVTPTSNPVTLTQPATVSGSGNTTSTEQLQTTPTPATTSTVPIPSVSSPVSSTTDEAVTSTPTVTAAMDFTSSSVKSIIDQSTSTNEKLASSTVPSIVTAHSTDFSGFTRKTNNLTSATRTTTNSASSLTTQFTSMSSTTSTAVPPVSSSGFVKTSAMTSFTTPPALPTRQPNFPDSETTLDMSKNHSVSTSTSRPPIFSTSESSRMSDQASGLYRTSTNSVSNNSVFLTSLFPAVTKETPGLPTTPGTSASGPSLSLTSTSLRTSQQTSDLATTSTTSVSSLTSSSKSSHQATAKQTSDLATTSTTSVSSLTSSSKSSPQATAKQTSDLATTSTLSVSSLTSSSKSSPQATAKRTPDLATTSTKSVSRSTSSSKASSQATAKQTSYHKISLTTSASSPSTSVTPSSRSQYASSPGSPATTQNTRSSGKVPDPVNQTTENPFTQSGTVVTKADALPTTMSSGTDKPTFPTTVSSNKDKSTKLAIPTNSGKPASSTSQTSAPHPGTSNAVASSTRSTSEISDSSTYLSHVHTKPPNTTKQDERSHQTTATTTIGGRPPTPPTLASVGPDNGEQTTEANVAEATHATGVSEASSASSATTIQVSHKTQTHASQGLSAEDTGLRFSTSTGGDTPQQTTRTVNGTQQRQTTETGGDTLQQTTDTVNITHRHATYTPSSGSVQTSDAVSQSTPRPEGFHNVSEEVFEVTSVPMASNVDTARVSTMDTSTDSGELWLDGWSTDSGVGAQVVQKERDLFLISTAILGAVLLLTLALVLAIFCYKRRQKKHSNHPTLDEETVMTYEMTGVHNAMTEMVEDSDSLDFTTTQANKTSTVYQTWGKPAVGMGSIPAIVVSEHGHNRGDDDDYDEGDDVNNISSSYNATNDDHANEAYRDYADNYDVIVPIHPNSPMTLAEEPLYSRPYKIPALGADSLAKKTESDLDAELRLWQKSQGRRRKESRDGDGAGQQYRRYSDGNLAAATPPSNIQQQQQFLGAYPRQASCPQETAPFNNVPRERSAFTAVVSISGSAVSSRTTTTQSPVAATTTPRREGDPERARASRLRTSPGARRARNDPEGSPPSLSMDGPPERGRVISAEDEADAAYAKVKKKPALAIEAAAVVNEWRAEHDKDQRSTTATTPYRLQAAKSLSSDDGRSMNETEGFEKKSPKTNLKSKSTEIQTRYPKEGFIRNGPETDFKPGAPKGDFRLRQTAGGFPQNGLEADVINKPQSDQSPPSPRSREGQLRFVVNSPVNGKLSEGWVLRRKSLENSCYIGPHSGLDLSAPADEDLEDDGRLPHTVLTPPRRLLKPAANLDRRGDDRVLLVLKDRLDDGIASKERREPGTTGSPRIPKDRNGEVVSSLAGSPKPRVHDSGRISRFPATQDNSDDDQRSRRLVSPEFGSRDNGTASADSPGISNTKAGKWGIHSSGAALLGKKTSPQVRVDNTVQNLRALPRSAMNEPSSSVVPRSKRDDQNSEETLIGNRRLAEKNHNPGHNFEDARLLRNRWVVGRDAASETNTAGFLSSNSRIPVERSVRDKLFTDNSEADGEVSNLHQASSRKLHLPQELASAPNGRNDLDYEAVNRDDFFPDLQDRYTDDETLQVSDV